MGYTEPTDIDLGELSSSAQRNQETADNIRYLYNGMPYVELKSESTETIPNGSWTALTGWTEVYDLDSMYSGGSEIAIPETGVYRIHFEGHWSGLGIGYEFWNGYTGAHSGSTGAGRGGRRVALYQDGTTLLSRAGGEVPYYNWGPDAHLDPEVHLFAGVTLSIRAFQDSGTLGNTTPVTLGGAGTRPMKFTVRKVLGPQT